MNKNLQFYNIINRKSWLVERCFFFLFHVLVHCTITLDPDLGPDLVPCPRDLNTVTEETEVETTMTTDKDNKGVLGITRLLKSNNYCKKHVKPGEI